MPRTGRPNILHIVVAGEIGGAERFLADLASRPELSRAGHVVALMTPNTNLHTFFSAAGLRLRDRGRVRENPFAYLWRSYGPADIAWLCTVAREEEAHILHAHTYGSHVLAARTAWRTGLPLLRTEHGVRHYRDPTCALNRHWALEAAQRLAAVSDYVGRLVAAVAPEARGKIRVIPNGVDLERFRPAPPPSDGPFTFLVLSRLEAVKRVTLAIEAVAQVPDVRLNIAGEGSLKPRLLALVRRLGLDSRVSFLGHLADPRPAIAAADALVNCTREEGCGLAMIEAAAMGRPAVALDSGGTAEVIEDRVTGWLVREPSVAALSAALAAAGASRPLAAAYGLKARARAEARFGLAGMCRAYGELYAELASSCA